MVGEKDASTVKLIQKKLSKQHVSQGYWNTETHIKLTEYKKPPC